MSTTEQKQRIIALAQSEHAQAIVELFQYLTPQQSLVGENEYATIVNAVKMDTRSDMVRQLWLFLDGVKGGTINIGTMQ